MPNPKKEDAPPPTPIASSYGSRPSSVDELEQMIARQVRARLGQAVDGDSPISPLNAGAHDVWIPRFLIALELSGNWSLAARVAGVDKRTPAHRADADAEFARQAKEAEDRALDLLEAACFKSAVYGDLEPVFHQGVMIGEITRYSDRMRELLLKAGRPEKYRERLSVDSTHRSQAPALTAEDRQKLVLELLPGLGDYARFLKAKPVIDLPT